MSENFNATTVTPTRHYIMMPGDKTMYRFSITRFNPQVVMISEHTSENYILSPGVDPFSDNWVLLAINMPGGSGVGVVDIAGLLNIQEEGKELIGYLEGHGFGDVNIYTLAAVLLALTILVDEPRSLDKAAEMMLDAPALLEGYK